MWSGRLSLKVDSNPPSSVAGGFELKGRPEAGELTLFTPFGGTLAVMSWTPDHAVLRTGADIRHFNSLEELATQATGAAIPVAALFNWLAGAPTEAAGWQADLSRLDSGHLVARRDAPPPAAELRLVMDR